MRLAFTLSFFLFTLFLAASYQGYSQITLEATYSQSGTYTQLPLSGTKFYLMDVVNSKCLINNANHTNWKTINLAVPANNYLYDIKYLSENLFTTDNSLCLSYVYYNYNSTGQYYSYTAKVVKENGSVLLTIPGCQYLYVYTFNDGSTKLVTYSYDNSVFPSTIQTAVYNLPGALVAAPEKQTEPLFAIPNPAQQAVRIPYQLPAEIHNATLELLDVNGKKLRSFFLNDQQGSLLIGLETFPRGTYFYFIEAENYRSATGKLIVN